MSFRSLTALLVFAASLPAQGTFQQFGPGCPGSGTLGPVCASNNPNATTPWNGGNTNEFCLEVIAPTPMVVTGFEIFTLSTATGAIDVPTGIHLDDGSGTRPALTPVRTGVARVGTTAGFWPTSFAPLVIMQGQRFYLWFADGRMRHPIDNTPSATLGVHFYRTPPSTPWNGPFTSFAWAWRVNCVGTGNGPAAPAIAGAGTPTIATQFDLLVINARPATFASLLFGLSNSRWGTIALPADLTPIGAPGCQLLVSGELTFGAAVATDGIARVALPIPNTPTLSGFMFHAQWAVLDQSANTLGFAFSNAGTATVR